jgi:hypothetical protein
MVLNVVLERILPGERVQGAVLEDGTRLDYVLSGHLQFWVTVFLCLFAACEVANLPAGSDVWVFISATPAKLSLVYDEYLGLITASVVFSALLSLYLYISSFLPNFDGQPKILAAGGNTGMFFLSCLIHRMDPSYISLLLSPQKGMLSTTFSSDANLIPALAVWI